MNPSTPKPNQDSKKAPESSTSPKPPPQSQVDQERGDWEGMGQSRYQPDTDAPAAAPDAPSTKH